MNIDRLFALCLTLIVLNLLYHQHWLRLKWLWQRTKDRLPRKWNPDFPRDCTGWQAGVTLVSLADPTLVVPWSECKSNRGRKKRIDTGGYACPHPDCEYYGIGDAAIHALVGYGWIDTAQTIRKLCCQACRKPCSARKGTPLYDLKTEAKQVEMVLWFLAEGIERAVMIRFTGQAEATLARWLQRAGLHSQARHQR